MTASQKYGIFITVIFHLLLAIFLLLREIAEMHNIAPLEIEFEVPSEQEKKQEEELQQKLEDLRRQTAQQEVEEMLRSVAVNQDVRQNNRSQEVQKYIDEVNEELESSEYGDRYKAKRDKNFVRDSIQHSRDKLEKQLDSLKSTFYSGESSVSYKLEGRYACYLPIPVFRCEFGGKVVLQIQVNRKGNVQKAEVSDKESSTDECLREVAVESILRSRFNEKASAPQLQTGVITYIFVKQ